MTHRLFKRRTNTQSLHEDNNTSKKIEELIHQIAEHKKNNSDSRVLRQENEPADNIVFQIELDNICYTLLRSQPKLNPHPLSPREQEIARLVVKGLPNKVISSVLGISVWTVSAHLKRIFAKLNVTRRSVMVARVLEDDLLRNRGPK